MYAACGGEREKGGELGHLGVEPRRPRQEDGVPPAPLAELLSFLALVDLIETDGSRH